MNQIINKFVDSGLPKYGIYALGMFLIYNLTLSAAQQEDKMID